jgi:exosortase/archaeosortase
MMMMMKIPQQRTDGVGPKTRKLAKSQTFKTPCRTVACSLAILSIPMLLALAPYCGAPHCNAPTYPRLPVRACVSMLIAIIILSFDCAETHQTAVVMLTTHVMDILQKMLRKVKKSKEKANTQKKKRRRREEEEEKKK